MIPSHHPHPETLVAYAAGTLLDAPACVVVCHLSLCAECAEQVRWLERLGGVLLHGLETGDAETDFAERAAAQWSVQPPPYGPQSDTIPEIADPLFTSPLARFTGLHGAEISWQPVESGMEQCSIRLSPHDGSIKLLRLSPGQHLPEQDDTFEAEAALVLQGACRNSAGTYVRGDVIERTRGPLHSPMVFGEAECICLMTD